MLESKTITFGPRGGVAAPAVELPAPTVRRSAASTRARDGNDTASVYSACVRRSNAGAAGELLLDGRRIEAARGEQHVGVEPEVRELLDQPLVALRGAGER